MIEIATIDWFGRWGTFVFSAVPSKHSLPLGPYFEYTYHEYYVSDIFCKF